MLATVLVVLTYLLGVKLFSSVKLFLAPISESFSWIHLGIYVSQEAMGQVFPALLWSALGSGEERWSELACVAGWPFHGIIITKRDSEI